MTEKEVILLNKENYEKVEFKKEEDLVNVFIEHYKDIISNKSLFLNKQKQFKSKKFKNFNHSIGDGFLILWENPTTPVLYLVEVELAKHSMDKHILPQIGNFITFIQSANREDELRNLRDFLYQEIKSDKQLFKSIQKETDREVYEILDNALSEIQIMLVIDKIPPELSIGLSQIEKAIRVKIRKIEVSLFKNKKGERLLLYKDSEKEELAREEEQKMEEYSLDYHLSNKPDKIVKIVNEVISFAKQENIKIRPMKHYIGFYKSKSMLFSCVVRKNSVIIYSKGKVNELRIPKELQYRDVSNIGHYTNHLPTEIVIKEEDEVEKLKDYLNSLVKNY